MVVAPRERMKNEYVSAGLRSGRPDTRARAASLQVDAYRGGDGLSTIRDEWQALAGRQARQRFVHWFGWFAAYLENLDDDPDAIRVFVVRRGGTPVALFPLKFERHLHFGMRTGIWSLPVHPHLPLSDILCAEDESVTEIVTALAAELDRHTDGRWDALRFAPVLQESALSTMKDVPRCRQHVRVPKICEYVDCTGDYEEIRKRFSKNFRSNLNKARNKLARRENVQFLSDSALPDLQPAFDEFLQLEASGWKGADGAGTAIVLHPELKAFYQSLIDTMAAEGGVVVNRLKVEGKLVAAQLCVKDRHTLYILKLAYDEKSSRMAPGNMLVDHAIRQGTDDGAWQDINLVGNPPWFADWGPEHQDVLDLWFCRRTVAGLWSWLIFDLKKRLVPLHRRLAKRQARRK